MGQKILSNMASNPKTAKELRERKIEGVILHLASADSVSEILGREVTVCPLAKVNKCDEPCLDPQGRGRMNSVQDARLKKTARFFTDRKGFMADLRAELRNLEKRAKKKDFLPVARLDGTSDLGLALKLSDEFPKIQFYDYTKVTRRMQRWMKARKWWPVGKFGSYPNVHMTYSLGAGNKEDAINVLNGGGNVAVVFRLKKGHPLPSHWEGYEVIDGDKHDFRFLDQSRLEALGYGVVIGLRAKGTSFHDTSGFVQETD
jgi:hypothetical protein